MVPQRLGGINHHVLGSFQIIAGDVIYTTTPFSRCYRFYGPLKGHIMPQAGRKGGGFGAARYGTWHHAENLEASR